MTEPIGGPDAPYPERREDEEERTRWDALLEYVRNAVRGQWIVVGTALVIALLTGAAVGYQFSQQDKVLNEQDRIIRQQAEQARQGERERVERINQSCTISERKQRKDVEELRRIYTFLTKPDPTRLERQLRPLIIANLSVLEAEALEDDAPEYCDAEGVGEAEPDPELPPRPVRLR